MSRREFLAGLLAMSVAAFEEAAMDAAAALDEVWDRLLDDSVEQFVDSGGALGFGSAPEPESSTRSEAFDFEHTMLEDPVAMAEAVDGFPPLGGEIRQLARADLLEYAITGGRLRARGSPRRAGGADVKYRHDHRGVS